MVEAPALVEALREERITSRVAAELVNASPEVKAAAIAEQQGFTEVLAAKAESRRAARTETRGGASGG